MRGRQASLRPASVEATAFLSDLGRYRYGMKMKRQEKDRKKQQQPDEAAAPRGAGFHAGSDHNQLFTQVKIGCQSGAHGQARGTFAVRPLGQTLSTGPGPTSNSPITKNNFGTSDLPGQTRELRRKPVNLTPPLPSNLVRLPKGRTRKPVKDRHELRRDLKDKLVN